MYFWSNFSGDSAVIILTAALCFTSGVVGRVTPLASARVCRSWLALVWSSIIFWAYCLTCPLAALPAALPRAPPGGATLDVSFWPVGLISPDLFAEVMPAASLDVAPA